MNLRITLFLFILFFVSACTQPPEQATTTTTTKPPKVVTERVVADPDRTTYKNLTELKPEVTMLYETFVQDPLDHEWIWSLRLRLAQAYEYEKGKEAGDAAGKISAIRKLFDNDLDQRGKSGPWTDAQRAGRTKAIEDAFDSAIKAARSKE